MDLKAIVMGAIAVIGTALSLPLILKTCAWVLDAVLNPSTVNMTKAGELIAEAAIPDFVTVVTFLCGFGTIGGLLAIAYLYLSQR